MKLARRNITLLLITALVAGGAFFSTVAVGQPGPGRQRAGQPRSPQ